MNKGVKFAWRLGERGEQTCDEGSLTHVNEEKHFSWMSTPAQRKRAFPTNWFLSAIYASCHQIHSHLWEHSTPECDLVGFLHMLSRSVGCGSCCDLWSTKPPSRRCRRVCAMSVKKSGLPGEWGACGALSLAALQRGAAQESREQS